MSPAAPDETPLRGVTIDGPASRDLDDALWVERQPDGWRVTVCVADASLAVLPGGEDDARARAMGATRYFATGNSPMLPRPLSEDRLSLRPHRPRPVLVVRATLSLDLGVAGVALSRGHLTSEARLTYDEVPDLLGDASHPLHPMLSHARDLALALCAHRRAGGAFAFYDLNQGWLTTEEGAIRQLADVRSTIAHLIVQECMVLANGALATWAARRDVPVLYRNHTSRLDPASRAALAQELSDIRVMPPGRLEALRVRTHLLLDRASYGPVLQGHFGLNLPAYLHGTSPIRRYPDLVNHRQLLAALAGETPPHTHEELLALGLHLQALAETERTARSDAYKGRDEARVAAAVNDRRLDGLDAAGFERATKMAVRAGTDPDEGFVEGFGRRAREGRAPMVALLAVATLAPRTEAWAPVLDATVAALALRPADAVSLLAAAQQTAAWPKVSVTCEAEGPSHGPTFRARALLGEHAGEAAGAQRKGAEQWAQVCLVAALLGRPAPEAPAAPEPAPPPVPAPAPSLSGQDPTAALHEWCQAGRAPAPTFAFTSEGPSHQPTFEAEVTAAGRTARGRGNSKQEAKRAASAAFLARLGTP